ncbi:hypothetical protein [Longimicrobium sp.]|uniref:hypothetical protein n=1 Tax=Longimicrobium sp. TaxID=2029185 RepID=UPI002CD61E8D|nr:hypothetical protein [Longimicrobium sp.]HSU15377.1 hypothetical protein [Longimicrobium sp.]
MEKKRLTLDELEVQSFSTTRAAAGQRGTVRGHDAPTDQVECPTADVNWNTCWGSCGCGSGGNTDDCTVICESDACSAMDCSFGCPWETRGSWYATYC